MVFGPEKVELDLSFVRERVNQDDFVLVNRAASRLPHDAAKELKSHLYSDDGDHRSVLVLWAPCVVCSVRFGAVVLALRLRSGICV